jgi:hypothetical protein
MGLSANVLAVILSLVHLERSVISMKPIVIANFYIFLIVSFIGVFLGLNLKKWSSWLYGMYGLLTGFILGFSFYSARLGLELGAIFAVAVMYAGASVYWSRQRYK